MEETLRHYECGLGGGTVFPRGIVGASTIKIGQSQALGKRILSRNHLERIIEVIRPVQHS
jgi:hypothetical protein